ncbi:MAG: hypothetical protein ABI723_08470 [Bacteroidia bacterium]
MVIEIKKPFTKKKLLDAKKKLLSATKGFDAKKHGGKLKNVFGDALKYQKELRT